MLSPLSNKGLIQRRLFPKEPHIYFRCGVKDLQFLKMYILIQMYRYIDKRLFTYLSSNFICINYKILTHVTLFHFLGALLRERERQRDRLYWDGKRILLLNMYACTCILTEGCLWNHQSSPNSVYLRTFCTKLYISRSLRISGNFEDVIQISIHLFFQSALLDFNLFWHHTGKLKWTLSIVPLFKQSMENKIPLSMIN